MKLKDLISHDDEDGVVSVVVALMLVVLLGFAAISIDVGMMYAEKAQLQNGADSAALAVANDCAKGACGSYGATAGRLANANANDRATKLDSITFPSASSVQVNTSSRDISGGDFFRLAFANIFGMSTTDIRATATAAWGSPQSGTTLPWTFGKCAFQKSLSSAQLSQLQSTGNFTGDPSSAHILLRSDTNADYPGCTGQLGYATGGFGWLDLANGQCQANINVGTSSAGNDPGNNIPNVCKTLLPSLLSKPVLIPIFTTSSGNGQHATYPIYGFAAFQVTGWRFNPVVHIDPQAPACTTNCRGITGYFTRFVSLQEGLTLGSGPNLGGSIVQLTR